LMYCYYDHRGHLWCIQQFI